MYSQHELQWTDTNGNFVPDQTSAIKPQRQCAVESHWQPVLAAANALDAIEGFNRQAYNREASASSNMSSARA
jgi:hypothetical protein